ncbi:hypothetical protein DES53_102894 [Roseimicrobium gellanilyticum]|uniref:Uncharacterized protein n=1 Tax=Roseimicrobium gellanilyticum TaxID=748857 RepID=A0A366HU90_9BACT|nr:hypothetical protein [Roseimicrobium gellanilyticum]RBP46503.1 hypothetical protein DES53_102894 [Roseimicrobium gellanilyticum]
MDSLFSRMTALLASTVLLLPMVCSEQTPSERKMSFTVPTLQPDSIQSFGYKCRWIAIRTDDLQAVISTLGLQDCRVGSWAEGIQTAYKYPDGEVFVTPPVNGYILCVSRSLPEFPTSDLPDEITPILKRLAARFADVQYFFTYRVSDGQAWARFTNGTCTRAFAIFQGDLSWNSGELTPVEKGLDLEFPSEQDVMKVAGNWSIDPSEFEKKPVDVTQGIVGKLTPPST